ncbi:hypothetical protein [Jiella sonneratiae]|uniref:Uncharacterized protein n=1 Tax=Jiella sonneratiae TaxID=2816856 RepID=A0ABS3J9M6_9HYPH|nr:hypothetical protein [Jiella sonneratiae]MBO0906374.1 hypothetical protein [Jiella sonneratiae]
MIRNAIIALATVVTAGAALSAPASANGYKSHHGGYDYVRYEKVCHWKKIKVFGGYDECGNKIWVWKRVKSCH